MIIDIPIYNLPDAHEQWLYEIYTQASEGRRPDWKEVWVELRGKLPKDFTPEQISPIFRDEQRETIRLLGIIALEKNLHVLDKCDEIIRFIQELIRQDCAIRDVDIALVARSLQYSAAEVSMYLELCKEFGNFFRHVRYSNNSIVMKSIDVASDNKIFIQYMCFDNMKTLVLDKLNADANESIGNTGFVSDDPEIQATRQAEYAIICTKLDDLLKRMGKMDAGQEVLFEEIQEIKDLYFRLNKKNWGRLALAKLGDLAFDKLVEKETLSFLYDTVKDAIPHLLGS